MPSLHALCPDSAAPDRMPPPPSGPEVIDLTTDRPGPQAGNAPSREAALLAATALGMAVAGTQNPTQVLEGIADGDLAALHDARAQVCLLQVTDQVTRQAAVRLLEATAAGVSSSAAVDCCSPAAADSTTAPPNRHRR